MKGILSQCISIITLYILTILFVKYTYIKASLVAQRVKNPPATAEDPGLIPGSGRSPGEGNGNPLQYSCLGNLVDGGAWQATESMGCKESDITDRLNNNKYLNKAW